MICWQVNIREEGLELLDALSLRAPSLPRSYLRQLGKKQRIKIDNLTAETSQQVVAGQRVSIASSPRLDELINNSPLLPDQLAYEDDQCMVINKPAGLALHYAPGQDDNLISRAQMYLKLRREKFMVAPIQRLDIGTSGAVLLGKGKAAVGLLGKMMMAGGMSKDYFALVLGRTPRQGTLDSPVKAKGKTKTATTHYRRVQTNDHYSLLTLTLETGRQHQIRQQLADFNHPIIGDIRYGRKVNAAESRLMLHCYHLGFLNPINEQRVETRCPLPCDFIELAARLGFEAINA